MTNVAGSTPEARPSGRRRSVLVRSIDAVSQVCCAVAVAALASLVVVVVVDVTLRTVANHPVQATLDLVTYWCMPVLAILPLGLVQAHGEQIYTDLLPARLPRLTEKLVGLFSLSVSAAVVGLLVYYSWDTAMVKMRLSEAGLVVTWLPIWPVRFVLVVGLVAWALQLVLAVVNVVRDVEIEEHDILEGLGGS